MNTTDTLIQLLFFCRATTSGTSGFSALCFHSSQPHQQGLPVILIASCNSHRSSHLERRLSLTVNIIKCQALIYYSIWCQLDNLYELNFHSSFKIVKFTYHENFHTMVFKSQIKIELYFYGLLS